MKKNPPKTKCKKNDKISSKSKSVNKHTRNMKDFLFQAIRATKRFEGVRYNVKNTKKYIGDVVDTMVKNKL
jgi:hypothetical protein